MGNPDKEILEGINDYENFKHPKIIHTEYGDYTVSDTVFAVEQSLRQTLKWDEEPIEETTPFDDEGDVCPERFFDLNGKLRKESFKEIQKHTLGNSTYSEIYLPNSETQKIFLIDFTNKKCFSALPKGTSKHVDYIASFGEQEIVVFHSFDEVICLGSEGKQIGIPCVEIKKFENGKIDILWFRKWRNPNYEVNDLRTYREYLGSDGCEYQNIGEGNNEIFTKKTV